MAFSLAGAWVFGSLGAHHEFHETCSLVHSRLRFEFFRVGGEETGEGFYSGRSIKYGGQVMPTAKRKPQIAVV
ncbi:MAG: hypothetical protein OSB74_08665, partial [Verrucomicrobiota bacterium]|nr:hypothetical protein [Verrucomicrobiota bacterium]